jgi:phosphatidylinositol 3-kinase
MLPSRASLAEAGAESRPTTVTLIYKKGDDLRQDQLCVQLIGLMDRLLKRENLDMRLTPYRVLATGVDSGLVEYVPSATFSAVLAEHRTILRYFAAVAPDPGAPYGVSPPVFESFLRSCAGYCVVTYILGVGDRHLDNLMVAQDGRLFHIDFGFIMGRDPKMFPPPMKLCREMVEAMGGPDSAGYARFQTLACEAYNILRKSSPLFLSLMRLMAQAGIPDLGGDPDKTSAKLEEKFAWGLDDGAAVAHFAAQLEESASALFESLKENAHRIAMFLR